MRYLQAHVVSAEPSYRSSCRGSAFNCAARSGAMSLQLAGPGKLPALRRRSDVVGDVVGAFESETAAVFLRTAPANEAITIYVLAAMLIIGIGLAAVVKLDRVVNSAGRIETAAGSLYVSPFDTGIVRQINVKVG